MSKKLHIVAIDPQWDFCDPNGALYVSGADQDMVRLAKMVNRLQHKIDDIHVTMDSHQQLHIAHPWVWVDAKGNHPAPFTLISDEDVERGVWNPLFPNWRDKFLEYVRTLKNNGRYVLCIWPPHCIIGTQGHTIYPVFNDAIQKWAIEEKAFINYVTKGSNPFTEHYSAVQADVVDPKDPSTQLNQKLIQILQDADIIAITGQALSHCVANTIRDIANNFGEDNIKKFYLIRDTTSNVTGFESLGEDFIKEMTARGMNVTNSVDFLAA
jgi:nicotinamidase-related amidase